MKECIITQGERWENCSSHKNSNGEHGEYLCIHVYVENGDLYSTHYCKLMDFEIEEELFLL